MSKTADDKADDGAADGAAGHDTPADTNGKKSGSDSSTEIGGRDGPDPTRYGDWEKNGRCIDF